MQWYYIVSCRYSFQNIVKFENGDWNRFHLIILTRKGHFELNFYPILYALCTDSVLHYVHYVRCALCTNYVHYV